MTFSFGNGNPQQQQAAAGNVSIKRGAFTYSIPAFSAFNVAPFKDAIFAAPPVGTEPGPVWYITGPPELKHGPTPSECSVVVSAIKDGSTHHRIDLKITNLIGAMAFPSALDGSCHAFKPPNNNAFGEIYRQLAGPPKAPPPGQSGLGPVVTLKSRRQFSNVVASAEIPVVTAMTRLGARPMSWGPNGLSGGETAAAEAGLIGSGFLRRLGIERGGANVDHGPLVSAAPTLAAIILGKTAGDTAPGARLQTLPTLLAAAGVLGGTLDIIAQAAAMIVDADALPKTDPEDSSSPPISINICAATFGEPYPVASLIEGGLETLFARLETAASQCVRDRSALADERTSDPPPGAHVAADAAALVSSNVATRAVSPDHMSLLPGAPAPAPAQLAGVALAGGGVPAPAGHPAGGPTFARCARPGCPCPASWNGLAGQFCGFTCRNGTPCTAAVHMVPTSGAWLQAGVCPPCGPPAGAAVPDGGMPAGSPAAAAAGPPAPAGAAPGAPVSNIARARADGLVLVPATVDSNDPAAMDAAILRLAELAGWCNFHGLVGRGANPRPPDDTVAAHMCWYSAAEIVHAVERVGAYVMWVRPDTEVDAAAQIAHVMTINLSPTPANEPDERDASTPVVDGTVKVAGAKSSEFALAPPQSAFHTLASVNFGAAADTPAATAARGASDALFTQANEACRAVEGAPEALARVVASNGKPRATGSGIDARVTVAAWPLAVRDELLVEAARLMTARLPDRAVGFGDGGAANPSAAKAAALATAERLLGGQFQCKDVTPFLGQGICASSTAVALGSVKSKDDVAKAFKRLAEPLDLVLNVVMACPRGPAGVGGGSAILAFVEWMLENITGDAAVLVHLIDNHLLYCISKEIMEWRGATSAPPPDIEALLRELRVAVREAGHEARLKFASQPNPKAARAAKPAAASTPAKRQKQSGSPATPKAAAKPAAPPSAPRKGATFKDRWNAYDRAINAPALAEADKPCFMFFCGNGCAAACQKGRRHLITADQKRLVAAAKTADGTDVATPAIIAKMDQFTG